MTFRFNPVLFDDLGDGTGLTCFISISNRHLPRHELQHLSQGRYVPFALEQS